MVFGLPLLISPPALAGESWRALSTVRIRTRPSTAADTVRLVPMGGVLEEVGRLGNWVELTDGWVHHSLIGAEWVAPPTTSSPRTERGALVAWTPTTLFELQAGNDLTLCARPLDERPAPPCVRGLTPRALRDASEEARVADFWDRNGRAVQDLLKGARPVVGTAVQPSAWFRLVKSQMVTPDGAEWLLTAVEREGQRIWTAPDFTRTTVSATRLGTHLLVEFTSVSLEGSSTVHAARVVPVL